MVKWLGHPRFSWLRKRYLFNIYLLVGSISIVVATTIFTIRVSKSVEKQSRLTTEMMSTLAGRLWEPLDAEQTEPVLNAINEIEVPFIITDQSGKPVIWNENVIGIPLPRFEVLQRADGTRHTNPAVAEILSMVAAFDEEQEPFAIKSSTGKLTGRLHYGRSTLSQQIRYMPYLELMIMVLFFLIILWALQGKKDAEQKALFAGMAKETAHQLGTPLTSIMGWVALLEDKVGAQDNVMIELNRDVDRLSRISARFSQIGSRPKLEDTDFTNLVDEGVEYYRRRLPQLGGRVELRREGVVASPVRFNRDLMGWVIENLIRNGIDALKDGKGTITVKIADRPEGGASMLVTDTGRGIPSRVGNKIFEPGFTTKKRGWGMGLALVKRIVTQYHNGRITVAETSKHGTTFQVLLPEAESMTENAAENESQRRS